MNQKVLILDAQEMFVQGVRCYLNEVRPDIDIAAICCYYEDALTYLENESFDLFIFDLNISDKDGISILKDLASRDIDVSTLVLSSYSDSKFVRAAMLAGADGFISKNSSIEELLEAVETVVDGEVFMAKGLSTTPAAYDLKRTSPSKSRVLHDSYLLRNKLTSRETEILTKITEGKSNKQIGNELYISDQTVGVHRKNIMKKLGLTNTVKLIKFAIENQLV